MTSPHFTVQVKQICTFGLEAGTVVAIKPVTNRASTVSWSTFGWGVRLRGLGESDGEPWAERLSGGVRDLAGCIDHQPPAPWQSRRRRGLRVVGSHARHHVHRALSGIWTSSHNMPDMAITCHMASFMGPVF